jgi:ribosomal protein S18 acetylase RimI-like enzyme
MSARLMSAGPIALRDAEPGDRAFLLALYASTREELALAAWPDEVRALFVRMQFEAQATDYARRHPASRCRVIELQGRPVGRLWLARMQAAMCVLDISLLPEARGRGIGGACLRQVIDEAAGQGLAVELSVAVGNPARRLYERLGLHPVGEANVYQPMRRAAPHHGIAATEVLEVPDEQT